MIDAVSYASVANMLGEVYSLGTEAVQHLDDIAIIISDTNIPAVKAADATIVTSGAANAAAVVTSHHVVISQSLNDLVVALQRHVIARFGSLADFFDAESILVTPSFATLSNACGFSIPVQNVRYPETT